MRQLQPFTRRPFAKQHVDAWPSKSYDDSGLAGGQRFGRKELKAMLKKLDKVNGDIEGIHKFNDANSDNSCEHQRNFETPISDNNCKHQRKFEPPISDNNDYDNTHTHG